MTRSQLGFLWGLFCITCLGLHFADCCMNEVEFRICTNCKNIQHTHIRLTALFPGLPGSAGTRKVKPIGILLKQEIVSGSGINWAICKCAPCSRQITTPTPHQSVFLQAGCPSCRPTNSVKALKVQNNQKYSIQSLQTVWKKMSTFIINVC